MLTKTVFRGRVFRFQILIYDQWSELVDIIQGLVHYIARFHQVNQGVRHMTRNSDANRHLWSLVPRVSVSKHTQKTFLFPSVVRQMKDWKKNFSTVLNRLGLLKLRLGAKLNSLWKVLIFVHDMFMTYGMYQSYCEEERHGKERTKIV